MVRTAVNNPTAWQTRVPHDARSAAAVRRWLADILDPDADRLADLHAVATELICNAVRHATPLADGDISVSCLRDEDIIELAVTDGGGRTRPRLRPLDTAAADGRGLLIVSALASGWGVRDDGGGTTVWARLAGSHDSVVGGP